MDREAAVIRAEMSQTRAELDRKITLLETRAKALTPGQLTRRYLPDVFRGPGDWRHPDADRRPARLGTYKNRRVRRQELETVIASNGRR